MEGHTTYFFYRKCMNKRGRLLIYNLDTAANSQDGSSLELVAAAAARECNIQAARDRGLCSYNFGLKEF